MTRKPLPGSAAREDLFSSQTKTNKGKGNRMLYKLVTADGKTVVVVAHDIREISVGRDGNNVWTASGNRYAVSQSQAELLQGVMEMCHPATSEAIMALEPMRPAAPIHTDMAAAANQATASQGQPGAAANMRGPAAPSAVPFYGHENITDRETPPTPEQQAMTAPPKVIESAQQVPPAKGKSK